MKLRLAAQAVRLRILRSELAALERGETLRESVLCAPGTSGSITYTLAVALSEMNSGLEVACECGNLVVTLSPRVFARWRRPDEVGVYVAVTLDGAGPLNVVIEKDFACLDSSDADNRDTFEHPQIGAVC